MKAVRDTRERLVDAAYRLALRKGFDRTSVSEVIAEAGVQRGSLYHYFPGKNDLGLAVLDRDRVGFIAMLDAALPGTGDPSDVLEGFFAAALKQHQETGFVGGCLWGNTALEMSDTNPAYAALVEGVFSEWLARVEAVIRRGQERDQFRADVDATSLARLIIAGLEGAIMMSRLTKSALPLETCTHSLLTMMKA